MPPGGEREPGPPGGERAMPPGGIGAPPPPGGERVPTPCVPAGGLYWPTARSDMLPAAAARLAEARAARPALDAAPAAELAALAAAAAALLVTPRVRSSAPLTAAAEAVLHAAALLPGSAPAGSGGRPVPVGDAFWEALAEPPPPPGLVGSPPPDLVGSPPPDLVGSPPPDLVGRLVAPPRGVVCPPAERAAGAEAAAAREAPSLPPALPPRPPAPPRRRQHTQ